MVALTLLSLGFNAVTDDRARPPSGLRYVQAGDVLTRYTAWGDTAAGGLADGGAAVTGPGGADVVLVHGAAESADIWSAVGPLLASRHRVYALDLDGWGYSRRVPPFSADHQTRQLLDFVAALHLRRPLLVGHSSGAAIVAAAALRAPSRVGGVMFLDGDALSTGAGEKTPFRHLVLPPYRTTVLRLALGSDTLVRAVYQQACGPRCPALDEAGVDRWRRPMQVPGAEAALWALLDEGVPGLPTPALAALRGLTMPKAVVFGAQDGVFTAATPQQTADRIGAPAPYLIPGAGHLPMISDPDVVAARIDDLAVRAGAAR